MFGIRSLIGYVRLLPVVSFQCSTPKHQLTRRQPKSCFRENQLLQSSISFSLQPTSHPRVLNGSTVRASLLISQKFTLLMGSSLCFGSTVISMVALFRLAFAAPPRSQALRHKEITVT